MIMWPILTTSLTHFSLKGWKNVLFELGSESVNWVSHSPYPPPPQENGKMVQYLATGHDLRLEWENSNLTARKPFL